MRTPRCSRRFGIPAEHYHKSFLTNSMIRLSISTLLCGRNAAPPTIANWHAEACCHADAGFAGILPAMMNCASSGRVAGWKPAYP